MKKILQKIIKQLEQNSLQFQCMCEICLRIVFEIQKLPSVETLNSQFVSLNVVCLLFLLNLAIKNLKLLRSGIFKVSIVWYIRDGRKSIFIENLFAPRRVYYG